jgi:predicted DNA-binding ribbon-helix-helix protein
METRLKKDKSKYREEAERLLYHEGQRLGITLENNVPDGYAMGKQNMHVVAKNVLAKVLEDKDKLSNSAQFRRVEIQQFMLDEKDKQILELKELLRRRS